VNSEQHQSFKKRRKRITESSDVNTCCVWNIQYVSHGIL